MAVEKLNLNVEVVYRNNLDRPLSAQEFDGNFEKIVNALNDLSTKVNELVDSVNSLDQRVTKLEQNSQSS